MEIGKAESLLEKKNLKQNRRDDRRDIGKKNEIFKHRIKGIKKITGKYNTSKPLTEVKISCPCGLKWTWQSASDCGVISSRLSISCEFRIIVTLSATLFFRATASSCPPRVHLAHHNADHNSVRTVRKYPCAKIC